MHKNIFKSKKSPADVVKTLKEAVLSLDSKADGKADKKADKTMDEISKSVTWMKTLLLADAGTDTPESDLVMQLASEMYQSGMMLLLVRNLNLIGFECRKDVVQVFNCLLRRQIGSKHPTVDYVSGRPEIIATLLAGYETHDVALVCGTMLRECLRYQALAKCLLDSPSFYHFFGYVEVPTFDVASDAFQTLRELLTRHKVVVAAFLDAQYDIFFSSDHYQRLLLSDNYVTRRQSLNLLSELLLDRHNYSIMTRYISHPDHLKLVMNILRDPSRHIQFEAFHVFKIFVANPSKPAPVQTILVRNQHKLVDFLTEFQVDRTEDEQFQDEKSYLIKQIQELKM